MWVHSENGLGSYIVDCVPLVKLVKIVKLVRLQWPVEVWGLPPVKIVKIVKMRWAALVCAV